MTPHGVVPEEGQARSADERLVLRVENAIHRRGVMFCVVAIERGGVEVFRDRVDLDSSESRRRFVKRARETAQVEVRDEKLLELGAIVRNAHLDLLPPPKRAPVTVTPWPDVVDGPGLLRDVEKIFERYVIMPAGGLLAIAAWTVATWVFDVFDLFPLLVLTSPTIRSGKTLTLDLLSFLVRTPRLTATVSAAALFRLTEEQHPTLLIDEAQVLRESSERGSALRDLISAGYRRGEPAVRVELSANGQMMVREYDTFAPRALALIGDLPPAIADRAILIRMKRKAKHEHVERFRWREVRAECTPIASRLARWSADHREAIAKAYSSVEPFEFLDDRAGDNWAVLQTIVLVTDPTRIPDLERSARALVGVEEETTRSLGIQLLMDVRTIFEERKVERISTTLLVEELRALEISPWSELGPRGLTPHRLGRMLKSFGIRPQVWWDNHAVRGYLARDFEDAWARYTPTPPLKP